MPSCDNVTLRYICRCRRLSSNAREEYLTVTRRGGGGSRFSPGFLPIFENSPTGRNRTSELVLSRCFRALLMCVVTQKFLRRRHGARLAVTLADDAPLPDRPFSVRRFFNKIRAADSVGVAFRCGESVRPPVRISDPGHVLRHATSPIRRCNARARAGNSESSGAPVEAGIGCHAFITRRLYLGFPLSRAVPRDILIITGLLRVYPGRRGWPPPKLPSLRAVSRSLRVAPERTRPCAASSSKKPRRYRRHRSDIETVPDECT